MSADWKQETMAVQGGYSPKATEPRIPAICQSTTFKFDSAEHVAKLFDLELADPMYTRISNPTTDAFEQKIAMMEGGVAALATSSGQAATSLAILNICRSPCMSPVAIRASSTARLGTRPTMPAPAFSRPKNKEPFDMVLRM